MFDLQLFKQPPASYRVHPFWFWNGDMEDDQIRLQIDEMADKGLGGFFICARQGLKVPYLSDAWFQKVRVAVEAAKTRGLNVWLYDEYPYPSGIAGGEVTLEHPEAKHYTLTHQAKRVKGGERLSMELPWARIVYAKAIPVEQTGRMKWSEAVDIRSRIGNYQAEPIFQKAGLTAYNQKRFFTYRTVQKLEWTVPDGEWEVLIVQEKEIEDFKYYGTFVDPCNREAMATFIRLTHDKYAEHLGEYFGTTIKGMFTDEIGLLGSIPWTPRLAEFFIARNGYDLRDHMHALLYAEADDAAKIRYDYYQSVHLLLLGAYHKQVHDWCERHGLQYVTEVPSVRMTTQRYSHVPGGDTAHEKLGRSLDWILNHQATSFRSNAKMVSSIARQLNRERNLIECFHSVGWSMTLQDAKWMIDRMASMGTNFFNFHAFFYTLDGLTKHDAPPSQFLQNPYWPHFKRLGDYAGRISYVMSCGQADIRIAVVQPTTSLWTQMGNPFHHFDYGGNQPEEERKLNDLKRWWTAICNTLTKSGRDFDHLDPELLAEAEVADGTMKLGCARYSVLILPPMTNLETAAWDSIERFLAQGGTVIGMGQLPYENIDPQASIPSAVGSAFGLTETARGPFWDEAGANAPQSGGWLKGPANAYYLPFRATASDRVLERMTGLLDELLPPAVRLAPACGEWGLLLQTRRISDDAALVFVSNQEGAQREVELRVGAQLWGAPESATGSSFYVECEELSLDDGDAVLRAEGTGEGAEWSLPVSVAPYESRLFRLTRIGKNGGAQRQASDAAPVIEIDAAALWELRPLQDNAVRFDTFRMTMEAKGTTTGGGRTEGADVQVKTFIDQCADLAGSAPLPVTMGQLFGTPMKIGMGYPIRTSYSASFVIEELPDHVRLAMDKGAVSGNGFLRINGQKLDPGAFDRTFLYDHMNVGKDITPYLREGVNEIAAELEIRHDWDGLVDALYLTGPFRVAFDNRQRPVLSRPSVQKLPLTAGPHPGYPYYAGSLSFELTLDVPALPEAERFELRFRNWDPQFHECAEVLVNGRSLGVRAWSPYRWFGASETLRAGGNKIEVRFTNTLIGLLEGKYFDYGQHALKSVKPQ